MGLRADKVLPESLLIRKATTADIESMWELDQKCFEPGIAYSVDIFYYHLLITHDPAFVAVDGDEIIGFILTSRVDPTEGVGIIITIDILEQWRRRGLGTRLITLAEDGLRETGVTLVELQTSVDNASALEFYEKHGYTNKARLGHYYGDDKDAYLFQKNI